MQKHEINSLNDVQSFILNELFGIGILSVILKNEDEVNDKLDVSFPQKFLPSNSSKSQL